MREDHNFILICQFSGLLEIVTSNVKSVPLNPVILLMFKIVASCNKLRKFIEKASLGNSVNNQIIGCDGMAKLSFLFEDLAKELGLSKTRIQKYRNLVADANKARAEDLLDGKLNQHDKAEELITFYTFAPIELRENKKEVIEEILKLGKIHETIEKLEKISFEKQYISPSAFLIWL
jgi:hypothetical protein